jgi:hypothetical protein
LSVFGQYFWLTRPYRNHGQSIGHKITREISQPQTRDRLTARNVEVLEDLTGINAQWSGIKSLIKVDR